MGDTLGEMWVLLTSAFGLGLLVGAISTAVIVQRSRATSIRNSLARYPRDWPSRHEIFAKDSRHQGYFNATGKQVISSKKFAGAARIGWVYPRLELFRLIPELWPLTRAREWLLRFMAVQAWIPYEKRFTHWSSLGPTGKGKTTAFAIPQLVYGALEDNTAYFAIDVKSPDFVRMLSRLYRNAGKDVYFFDPWSNDESLAFEPLWRASDDVLNQLAEVMGTYSPGGKEGSDKNEFFDRAAPRIMRGLVELAQFWPRRFCNLPCVHQLLKAGFDKVQKAFEHTDSLVPSFEEVEDALKLVIPASKEELRQTPARRPPELTESLEVLDRAGYRIARLTKAMRRYYQQNQNGTLSQKQFLQAEEAFWIEVRSACHARWERLAKLREGQGEYLDMPPETKGSVMSTLANKIENFEDTSIARAFSRDELDVRRIVEKPCLFLVGAPMDRQHVGSLFVASILTNLAMNSVFQRGAAISAGKGSVWKGGTIFLLDEFAQLNIRNASQALATFRSFKGALFLIYQDRGQLKQLYGEDFTNIEANCNHQVLLQGAHIDTCEFYAKAAGEVAIEKRSESVSDGESKKSFSKSIERVQLISTNDIRDGKLNGNRKEKLAFSVGSETPIFPILPCFYWDDPIIRKLLDLKRTVVREGPPWKWKDEWRPQIDASDRFIHRRKRNRRDRDGDPVSQRLDDPYGQYLDYLVGKPRERAVQCVRCKHVHRDIRFARAGFVCQNCGSEEAREFMETVYDELEVPNLDLSVVTGQAQTHAKPQGAVTPRPPGPPRAQEPPAPRREAMVPVYGGDFQKLVEHDFRDDGSPLPAHRSPGGDLRGRIEEIREEV